MIVRKKPATVEAHKWTGLNIGDTWVFMGCPRGGLTVMPDQKDLGLLILTTEGVLFARPGDWIIKGVKGEFYPCKPDIFEQTYEVV
jgi:hypothetical protein